MPRLSRRWRDGALGDAAFAAAYFLVWQCAVHGPRFASRQSAGLPKADAAAWVDTLFRAPAAELEACFIHWFGHYQFLKIIPAVPAALIGWLRDGWPLRLLTHIPTPRDVLTLQASGARPVTLLTAFPRALQPVLGKANGCDFLVHDLEHAWKFCHDPVQYRCQRAFFGLLERAIASGRLQPYLDDAAFAARFDYLISDMNTHPVHGLLYLHAVLIECLLRREGKDSQDPLSPPARAELQEVMRGLASGWGWSSASTAALLEVVAGGCREGAGRILEQAILAAPGAA